MKDNLTKILLLFLAMSAFFTMFYYMDDKTENTIIYETNTSNNDENLSKENIVNYDDYYNNNGYSSRVNGSDKSDSKDEVTSDLGNEDDTVLFEWEPNSPENTDDLTSQSNNGLDTESESTEDVDSNIEKPDTSDENDDQSSSNNSESEEEFPEIEVKPDELVQNIEKLVADISNNTVFSIHLAEYNKNDDALKQQIERCLIDIYEAIYGLDQGIANAAKSGGVSASIGIYIQGAAPSVGHNYAVSLGEAVHSKILSMLHDMCIQLIKNKGVYNNFVAEFSALNPGDFVYGQPNPNYVNELMFLSIPSQSSVNTDIQNIFIAFQTGAISDAYISGNSIVYQKYQVMLRYILG